MPNSKPPADPFATILLRTSSARRPNSTKLSEPIPLTPLQGSRLSEDSSSGPSSLRGKPRSRPTTPKSDDVGETRSLSRPSSKKGKEVDAGTTKDSCGRQRAEQAGGNPERMKEDAAMEKWRKWVIEQPLQSGVPSTSPLKGKGSPVNGGQKIPLVSLSNTHRLSVTNSSLRTPSAFDARGQSDPETSITSSLRTTSPRASSALASPFYSSGFGSPGGGGEIYNTDSVLALRDVELAVGDDALSTAERVKAAPRRMSNKPRLSEKPNPFGDVATRLGSRRVRPIVLELIQALGHFLDVVWSTTYPERSCPWIIDNTEECPVTPSVRKTKRARHTDSDPTTTSELVWKSPMITAVQEGKRTGHVPTRPTSKDLGFWRDEVEFGIRDVDEVVGVKKGLGRAFGNALKEGRYGPPDAGNALGQNGDEAGMARLLNDLEEAIWGDAPPRPTDLAFELPADFDPYALLDESELMAGGARGIGGAHPKAGSALVDLLGASSSSSGTPTTGGPSYDSLPDFNVNLASPVEDPIKAKEVKSKQRIEVLIPGIENIEGAEGMTLEELGRKRHQEWLASRAKA
ncbi:hypothetical protein L202_06599 [Cryptococcus amylolentus CBS 6039]|uniref:Uncharacterized protein n=2 Tax=Cryptococcus amylolentus TaxID=104669 RepID=A0A1E3HGI0_9TREE|nr:hypothetical protein L202_06599 [Cryptococcus amylolentus CBS 6039]ODN75460.1 hypothetical protein L202_06599 [Cryptococcus amylolentus CBS 6039]ODO03181.1 hypothetical protein I350_06026 [Cryptococcus amylolentus CBS 6273]